MKQVVFRCAFLGTEYCGWQVQAHRVRGPKKSVQEVFESCLSKIFDTRIKVRASGRTDAGVHALSLAVQATLPKAIELDKLVRGLNSLLPHDIRVLEARSVPEHFDVQKSAKLKRYTYFLQQGPCELPHLVPTSWWIRKKLDLPAMKKALRILEGHHEFRVFQASGGVTKTTDRTIFRTTVQRVPVRWPPVASTVLGKDFSLIRVSIEGSGFLKQMVRSIVGTLVPVGEERKPVTIFRSLLESQDRKLLGPTAPARGLWLEWVKYRD